MVHHECLLVSQLSREARAKMVKIRLASLRITYYPETETRTGREYDRQISRHSSVFSGVRVGGIRSSAKQLKIGTGHIGGTYYLSDRTNSCSHYPRTAWREAVRGKIPCGVPSLTASALTSFGSVENVEGVSAGRLDAGFMQSNVAYWA